MYPIWNFLKHSTNVWFSVGLIIGCSGHSKLNGIITQKSDPAPLTHWLSELFAKNAFMDFQAWLGQISSNVLKSKSNCKITAWIFFPLALHFMTFLLRHAQRKWARKWPTSFEAFYFLFFLFSTFLFLLFSSFYCIDWHSSGLASSSKTSEKASSRLATFTMEQPHVVPGNFYPSF